MQGEPWSLTPEQQARKAEVERYVLEDVYQGYRIVRTVEDVHGDIIDWIASDSMEPLPYAPPELPFTADSLLLPEGVVLAENELERYPELFGPGSARNPDPTRSGGYRCVFMRLLPPYDSRDGEPG